MNAEAAVATLARVDSAFALRAGILDNAGALPPGHRSFALERLATLQEIAAALRMESHAGEAAIDVEYFIQCVDFEAFALLELGETLKSPDALSLLCEHGLTLMFAPFDRDAEREYALHAFLKSVPLYLAAAASTLCEPDALWQELTLEIAACVPALFATIATHYRRSEDAAGAATAALHAFVNQLRAKKAKLNARLLRRDTYEKLSGLHGYIYDLRDIEAFAEERIAQLDEKRRRIAKDLTGVSDGKNAVRALQSDAPASFQAALTYVHETCRAARQMCAERALVPIPSDEEVKVIETPAFARVLAPFAAIITPKPLWPQQLSLYCLSARGITHAFLRVASVHAGYPGRHLQAAYANTKGSLWRNVPWTSARQAQLGSDCVQGWAHYCEALMAGQGFFTTVAEQFQVCNDALWRAHSMLLGIELSTGAISLEKAAQRLVDAVGMAPAAAMSEVRAYTLQPLQQIGYALGKDMIRTLRKNAEHHWQRGFSAERFHALIMSNGMAPLAVAKKRLAQGTS